MSVNFPELPKFDRAPNRGKEKVFELIEDMVFPDLSLVPSGFLTDGISKPKFIRVFCGKFGKGFASAIRHDYDYALQTRPRKEADKRFRRNLKRERMGFIRRNLWYRSLRIAGGGAWKKNARRPRNYFFTS